MSNEKTQTSAKFIDIKTGKIFISPIVDKTVSKVSSGKQYTIYGVAPNGRKIGKFVSKDDFDNFAVASESDIDTFQQKNASASTAEKKKEENIPKKCSFPKGWEGFSLEQKTEAIANKFGKLSKWDDMYEIKRQKVYTNAGEEQCGFAIVVTPGHHFTHKGCCICRKEPIPDSEIDWKAIPEDLALMMKANAFLGRLPETHALNMLNPCIGGETYKEAADKMLRYLDLLLAGYHVREVQWYMEKDHPELFPPKKKSVGKKNK